MTNKDWKLAVNSEVLKLEEGERIEGKFISIEESKKFSNSYALTIKTLEGNKVIFVNDIVKDLLLKHSIQHNQEIALLYVGKVKNQKGDNEYKMFELFYK